MAEKLTKNEKREAAREEARQRREQEMKKAKKRKIFTRLGVLAGILLAIGIVVMIVVSGNKPAVAQANPKNMLSNGVLFDVTVKTPVETPAIAKGKEATPTEPSTDKVNVIIYLDYSCPYCKKFEASQSKILADYVNKGEATVEYHPLAFLTNYSVAAGNASACVASKEPEKWWKVNEALFAAQPDEAVAGGWSQTSSINFVKDALKSYELNSETKTCIKETPYVEWLAKATSEALSGPLPNSNAKKVEGTPFVLVDGNLYQVDYINDSEMLSKVIEEAKKVRSTIQ